MSKRLTLLILVSLLGGCILAVFIGYSFYKNYNRESENSTPQVSFPNPLATISIPAEPAHYPVDWPADLKYPDDFILDGAASGILIELAPKGYSAQLRYQGTPPQALSVMVAFLQEKGWVIVDNTPLSSGGATLILQREKGSGHVVFDVNPTDASQTLITATFYP